MTNERDVLVIGSGGREHAICWKLSQSKCVNKIYCAPGSYGISQTPKVVSVNNLQINDFKAVIDWCQTNGISLVVVGPEDPLANGLADALNEAGIKCFGPTQAGAQIESNKDWAKAFMVKYGIPTARYQSFTNPDEAKHFIDNAPFPALVVKASGLAAGKGVIVAENRKIACDAVNDMLIGKKFGDASSTVVVEELLEGEEVSVLAFTDGTTVKVMLPAQDHKRVGEGDTGPNTGGMGAYCPCPLITDQEMETVIKDVLERAVAGLREEGIRYVGVLYAGMMLTSNGPKTLEFNCRFGDPETQVLLPMLESDLYLIMDACCSGTLASADVSFMNSGNCVGVVMASKGYPETSTKGCVISGTSAVANLPGHLVFHSGTACSSNGALVTNGGRVLLVCAIAPTLRTAASIATAGCRQIAFPGAHFRKDIAQKAISKCGSLSYLDGGVDIEAGKTLVRAIEPAARASHRTGVLGRLGCFGGLFHIRNNMVGLDGSQRKYQDPVLVEATDGVGTKLKIANVMNKYDTIGVDLVAMCVNDILCAGAEPFAFLDYIACGKLDVETAAKIIEGIATACTLSGCSLLGGETAEMPSMYEAGKYDLAGFAVGIVENSQHLPRISSIFPGDVVLGIPSTGVHSNGYSLVQKIMQQSGRSYNDIAPFSKSGLTFGEEFLIPTGLYVKPLLSAVKSGKVKALAHITGGGLLENIPRVLPAGVAVRLDASKFTINPVFGWLAAMGGVSEFEMLRTFNCGVGMIAVVSASDVDSVLSLVNDNPVSIIGTVENRINGNHQVIVDNFKEAFDPLINPYLNITCQQISRGLSYKDSGVDIEAGDNLIGLIKPLARSTTRDGCLGGLGGFGGLFRMNEISSSYKDPVLVMAANGVGTKLRIAQEYKKHDTVGVDLVAMCVNDILCNGGEPLTFLDYYACGTLDVNVAKEVISSVAEGCKEAKCALIGGETAEMPGMYNAGVYDIAGFALGVVERTNIMPKLQEINIGDPVIGLPSSGLHSNGFSLVHKIMEKNNLNMNDMAPFSEEGLTFADEFLCPTKIYAPALLPVIARHKVKAIAHITSGGLVGSIPRILPERLKVNLNSTNWHVHPVFGWIADTGNVEDNEMLGTFNCGLGMVLIVAPEDQAEMMNLMRGHGAMVVGSVQARHQGGERVVVDQFSSSLEYIRNMPIMPRKKIAVLISGNGSNLQALIDSTRDPNQGICADIVFVISNKSDAYGLERAKKAGIPTEVISHKGFASREEYDAKLTAALEAHKIDLICLAGFMRILSVQFVDRWRGRLVNIHPSLLPKHKGMNAQKQALEAGDTESGCSVHFVDDGVDTGPVIVQEKVVIVGEDTVETLSERIHHAEHRAYPRALRLLAGGRVRLGPDNRLLHIY